MTTNQIREKLSDYIRIADDKKVEAIYTILEGELTETFEWWNDKAVIHELDESYSAYKSGEARAYTLQEVEASVEELRQKRKSK